MRVLDRSQQRCIARGQALSAVKEAAGEGRFHGAGNVVDPLQHVNRGGGAADGREARGDCRGDVTNPVPLRCGGQRKAELSVHFASLGPTKCSSTPPWFKW